MVKRELAADPEIDVAVPRSKRHRDAEVESSTNAVGDNGASSEHEDANGTNGADAASSLTPEEVREEGLKVLQVLKDAVNKEGRQISYDFLRLPSKRQFPDYYEIIKTPLALDDIKTRLENHAYVSIEALREDLETCFKNAKRYNQRESVIWKDAKTLQKLANKEIDKVVRRGDEHDEGSDKEGGKKKEKGVNIHRLMKNRLQKLVAKTDETERQLSSVFMDLPSKKKWFVYYKLIQNPICIEDIFKRIKRKEYHTIQDFIDDVDLVFANAMQFNEDHSPIWEDALTLKTYFHRLMTDLPAKYNMNGVDVDPSASPEVSHNRIKLKLKGHHVTAQGTTETAHNGEPNTGTVRLRVPGGSGIGSSSGATPSTDKEANASSAKKKKATMSPGVPSTSLPSAASISFSGHTPISPSTINHALATAALAMPTPRPAKSATPAQQQVSSSYTAFHQYTTPNHIPPQNFYSPPAAGASLQIPARGSATPAPSVPQPVAAIGRTDAPSPVPPASAVGLYSVRLECGASDKSGMRRRLAVLDSRAGVRNFALRVPLTEAMVVVRSVKFAIQEEEEEEESEVEVEAKVVETPMRKRGRGRPKKVVPIDQEVKPPDFQLESSPPVVTVTPRPKENRGNRVWRIPSATEVQVKLDGQEIASSTKDTSPVPAVLVNGNGELPKKTVDLESFQSSEDEWTVEVTGGQHILEIGRKKSNVQWRVYLTVS